MSTTLQVDPVLGTATARFFRVLSDPTRLGILKCLLERPHTVSELVESLEVPQSRVSNHLACLRWCRFVKDERDGRQVTYHLCDERLGALIGAATALAADQCDHLVSCRRIGPEWI